MVEEIASEREQDPTRTRNGKADAPPVDGENPADRTVREGEGGAPVQDENVQDETMPDLSSLTYEDARSRLVEIVAKLEQGSLPLEESLELWELGEGLARYCQSWLDGARERLERTQEEGS